MEMYKINDVVNYNGKDYRVLSSVLYRNENYILVNDSDSVLKTILLKVEKDNMIPINYEGNEELYPRLITLFLGVE